MFTWEPGTIGAIVSVAALLLAIGGGIFWWGKFSNRVIQLETRVGQVEQKVDQLSEDLRKEMREHREQMQREMREHREQMQREMRDMRNELLEEMRRGNQHLLLALVNHSHEADGHPVFRVPVSPE